MQYSPVSVIVPTFNRQHFLKKAIGSILRQSCRCSEIIIVDDGSSDGTRGLIRTLTRDADVPLRYIRQENKGPAAARNLGIRHAVCDYVAFLDSDDYWHPAKLEQQFTAMQHSPEYHISHTREKWLRRGKHLNQKKKHQPGRGNIFQQCLQLCAVGMSTVMAKKDLFTVTGFFDESYPCCEDYELWLRVSAAYPFLLIDEPLTVKQGGRDDQLSQQYRIGMDRFRIRAMEQLLKQGNLDVVQQSVTTRELVKKLTIYGNGCLRHDRGNEGRKYLDRARELQQMTQERT